MIYFGCKSLNLVVSAFFLITREIDLFLKEGEEGKTRQNWHHLDWYRTQPNGTTKIYLYKNLFRLLIKPNQICIWPTILTVITKHAWHIYPHTLVRVEGFNFDALFFRYTRVGKRAFPHLSNSFLCTQTDRSPNEWGKLIPIFFPIFLLSNFSLISQKGRLFSQPSKKVTKLFTKVKTEIFKYIKKYIYMSPLVIRIACLGMEQKHP